MRLVAYGCRKYVWVPSFYSHINRFEKFLILVLSYEVQNFVAVCYRDDMASETKREGRSESV
jgi:hypothetical protein